MFYTMNPNEIIKKIEKNYLSELKKVKIQNIQFFLIPDVYPSQNFRTTDFLLSNIKLKVKNKIVCDMGCGCGIVGFYSLFNGAKKVSMADINPKAIENSKINKNNFNFSNKQASIYLSDCFDNFSNEVFDIIVFNIPFHSEEHSFNHYLDYALFDPGFRTLKKFLSQVRKFSHSDTEIIIAFSNKGDIKAVENIFDEFSFDWKLWKVINSEAKYDNRLYLLKL